jgi:hypothetical protein
MPPGAGKYQLRDHRVTRLYYALASNSPTPIWRAPTCVRPERQRQLQHRPPERSATLIQLAPAVERNPPVLHEDTRSSPKQKSRDY